MLAAKELVETAGSVEAASHALSALDKPEVLRLTNHDCSREFGDPVLVSVPGRLTVEVRSYDEPGIHASNVGSLLGDWATAKRRCEELLALTRQPTDAAA